MQRLFIIDGDFVAGLNVTQSKEDYVSINCANVSVRLAGMVDVVSTVAAATPVDAPNAVNVTDAQLSAMGPALGFAIRNALAGVFGNFATLGKVSSSKAALAVDL